MDRVRLLLAQVDRVAGIVRAGLNRGAWPTPLVLQQDLNEIATRMTRFLEPSFGDAGVRAELKLDGGRPVLATCDPAMVEQILLNLLKNAVEALPEAQVKYMTDKIPMQRCGTLDEVAHMATFIVSPGSSFTTGFTFDLTGGRATY